MGRQQRVTQPMGVKQRHADLAFDQRPGSSQ